MPSTVETVEMLARDYTFEINTGSIASPVWVEIGGLNTWTHSPSSKDADTTKFYDGGRESSMKTTRGDEFTLSGFKSLDDTVTARDPGQVAVETVDAAVGRDSRAQFRITEDDTGEAKSFLATVQVTSGGGGNDDPVKWEATLKVTGTITSSAAVSLPGTPTSPTGTNGTGSTVVDATLAGTFDLWEAVVTDSAGTTVLATVTSTSKPIYVPVSAGSRKAKVRARNAAGWGPYSALTATITVS